MTETQSGQCDRSLRAGSERRQELRPGAIGNVCERGVGDDEQPSTAGKLRRSRLLQWLGVVGVNLVVVAGLLAGLEWLAGRYFAPEGRPLFSDNELRTRDRAFVEPHAIRGFALRPNFETDLYKIDSEGFRRSAPALAGEPLWLFLGESTTFGWGVGNSETYPAELQRLAAENGHPVRVINAGVPSYSSSQVLLYLEELLAKGIKPDRIFISIMWNDIWYSTVLNWYPELLVYQQPPAWLTTLVTKSDLLRVVLMRPWPAQEELRDRDNPKALAYYRRNLRAMLALAAKHRIPVTLVEPPIAPDMLPESGLNELHIRYTRPFFLKVANQYRAAMSEVASEFAVPVATHRLSLAAGGGPKEIFLDLLHPTAQGNRMMAEDVWRSLPRD